MNKYRIIIISLVMLLSKVYAGNPAQTDTIRIGLSLDGPWDRNEELINLLRNEVKSALSAQAEVIISDNNILMGDWTKETITRLNDQLLADNEVDYVIGYGLMSSHDLAKRKSFPKPVIAPIVIDPSFQNIAFSSGTSGVKNLCYLIYPNTVQRDLELFNQITPLKKLVFITSKKYYETLFPNDAGLFKHVGENFKAEVINILYDDSADKVLSAIPKDANAVYLDFIPMSKSELQKITTELRKRRLPSFSLMGESEVKKGIMASANPDIYPRLIRRIALSIQRIQMGDDPGILSVTFNPAKRLYINLKTAFAVGVSPTWNTLLEAELINLDSTDIPGAQNFTLKSALHRIAEQNLDVLAKSNELRSEQEKVSIARSNLFPRIDLSATGLQLDQDRATAGYQPERSGTIDLAVRQVIFSEPAIANINIQSSLYDSKRSEYEVLRLNTVLEGAKMYLNYLRLRKLFYILLDNLKLVRENYDIAEIRQSTGSAGPEEKLRWEIEIANLRKTAMEVQSQMNQSQLALKQILNIPLIYFINLRDVSLDDPDLSISKKEFRDYLKDPVSFDLLTDFLVQQGIKNSKEIQQINDLMDAQEHSLGSIKRSYFVPTIAAFADLSNRFYKSSISQPFQLASIPSPPASIPVEFPIYMGQLLSMASPKLPNNFNWNIGLQFSLNLSDGFSTRSTQQKAEAEFKQLEYQKKAVEDKIALRIRYEMENLKSAYFGIQQSDVEQIAAQKTLKIITDAYSRGALSVLSLIDAQASSLRAEQVAVNAHYDLLIGYMQLQRSVGMYDLFLSPEELHKAEKEFIEFMSSVRSQR